MFHGRGVTKNFLAILEAEKDRSRRRIRRLAVLLVFVAGGGLVWTAGAGLAGVASLTLAFIVGAATGLAFAQYVALRRYSESIRANWNRWMRHSVDAVSVRECYRRVHHRRPGLGPGAVAALVALGLIGHVVLVALALGAPSGAAQAIGVFALDAALIGFFLARRAMERRWTGTFLRSVNELLREGQIGVWGVY